MSEPIRVAHVVGNLETGGMQRLVIELMRRLDRNIIDPFLVSMKEPNHFADEILEKNWEWHEARVCRLYKKDDLKNLARLFSETKPDIIHAHSDFACFAARAAASLIPPRPLIAHYHNTYEHRMDPFFLDREKLLAPRTDMFVACSDGVEDFMKNHLPVQDSNLRVITNGIDLNPIREARSKRADMRKKLGLTDDVFHIIHTARLEPHKDPGLILLVLEEIEKELGPWRLTYVGGGQMLEELKDEARHRGIAKNVEFVGWSNDVASYLVSADMLVFSSHAEGFGLVAAEALAAGVPVVATDLGPIRSVVTNEETALLFPVGQAKKLSEAVLRLHGNKELQARLIKAGLKRAEDFHIDYFVKGVEQAYLDLQYETPKGVAYSRSFLARRKFLRDFKAGKREPKKVLQEKKAKLKRSKIVG